jgi:IS30 family transposase
MQGWSTREIAKVVGVAQRTVCNDLSTEQKYSVDNQSTMSELWTAEKERQRRKSPSAPKRPTI